MTRKEFLKRSVLLLNTLFIVNKIFKIIIGFPKAGLKEAKFYKKY